MFEEAKNGAGGRRSAASTVFRATSISASAAALGHSLNLFRRCHWLFERRLHYFTIFGTESRVRERIKDELYLEPENGHITESIVYGVKLRF